MIIWILFLFSGIHLANGYQTTSVDLLQRLKSKNISCDLHDFIKSNDDSDDEYQLFTEDLTKYCSNSSSCPIICRMIFIELEIACSLPNTSRPTPMKYTLDLRPKQICSSNRLSLTNEWIWKKLSPEEKQQIGSTSADLCLKLTSNNETLRLAKFFYKIAPRIRRLDIPNKADSLLLPQPPASTNQTSNSSVLVNQQESKKALDARNQTLDVAGNKSNRTELTTNRLDTNQTLNVSKEKSNDEQKQVNPFQQQGENEQKRPEGGSPFGRAANNQERVQSNERPKPKVLDVESVFKADKDEERNWVEGKNLERSGGNLPAIKFAENPMAKSPSARKRNPFKLKFNRFMNDDDEEKYEGGKMPTNLTTTALIFVLCIVLIYLILHNRNKVFGLFIEGCKRRRAVNNRRIIPNRRPRLSQSNNQ